MVIDIIVITIAFISLIVVLFIVFRKSPVLSVIDPHKVPEAKENKIKNGLIETRLKRRLGDINLKLKGNVGPIYKKIEEKTASWYHKLMVLEKKYHEEIKKAPITLEEKDEQGQKIKELLKEAEELVSREDCQVAEKRCIEVLALDPKNIDAYHLLGDIYLEMKDFEHAKEIFKFLIKINAKDDRAFSGLGNIATSLGDLREAREDLKHSIDLNNKISSYHLNLARVYQAMGDNENTIKCCQEALALEPNSPKNINLLLSVCLETKNKGLAIRTYDRLKKANPENQKLNEIKKQIDDL